MTAWEQFLQHVPWFLSTGQTAAVGEPQAWDRGPVPGCPALSALLAAATVTPVSVEGRPYELLTWQDRGWLCDPPRDAEGEAVAATHQHHLTLAHRADGRLLLFAPDHDFDGVTPCAGCPPYSLLTIDESPDLTTWLETCASAWRRR